MRIINPDGDRVLFRRCGKYTEYIRVRAGGWKKFCVFRENTGATTCFIRLRIGMRLSVGTKHFGDWSSLREQGKTAIFSGFNKAGSILPHELLLQKLQRAFGGRFLL